VPAAEQVQVQMMHGLAAFISGVHDDAISALQLLIAGNLRRRSHQVTKQRSIICHRLRLRCDVLLRNDQDVRGSLRIDIRKADRQFVFVHSVCWNRASDDFAKQAIRGHGRSTTKLIFHLYKEETLLTLKILGMLTG
jgi:hypothetical protein